jgi:serine/threonine protein kinase
VTAVVPSLYLVTELCQCSLEEFVQGADYALPGDFYNFGCQIFEGVDFLHENGVAHRDLKVGLGRSSHACCSNGRDVDVGCVRCTAPERPP